MHDFVRDYLVRVGRDGEELGTLVLEMKGYDEGAKMKAAAAKRWCAAVNTDHKFGQWHFSMARNLTETNGAVSDAVQAFTIGTLF